MTDRESVLERLRSANPLPGLDHVDTEELGLFVSYFEQRRVRMTDTRTTRKREPTERQRRWIRPVLVSVTALGVTLVVIAALPLLIRGGESSMEPAAQVTIAPEIATVAETAIPDTVPPTTAVPATATVTSLSDRPEYFARMTVGPDGLPIVASFALDEGAEIGTIRLFFCADAACEEAEIVELMETLWIGRLELVAAPNGDLYLLVGESVMLYRDGELTTVPLMFNWPSDDDVAVAELPIAFTQDARPVFVGAMGENGLTPVVCADAACEGRTEVPLEPGRSLRHPGAFVDGDSIRVVYAVGVPTGPPDPEAGYDGAEFIWTTKVATVSDMDGTPQVDTIVVNEGINEFPSTANVAPDGSLVMSLYSYAGDQTSYSVLSCRNEDCNRVDAVGLGDWAYRSKITPDLRPINVVAEAIYDPDEYAAYLEEERRIRGERLDLGAEEPDLVGTNLVVIECVDTECTTTKRSTIAAMDRRWYLNSLSIEVAPNGTVYVLVGNDTEPGEAGLWLHEYPEGTLKDMVEPFTGTAVRGP